MEIYIVLEFYNTDAISTSVVIVALSLNVLCAVRKQSSFQFTLKFRTKVNLCILISKKFIVVRTQDIFERILTLIYSRELYDLGKITQHL